MYQFVALKASKVERVSFSTSHYSNAKWTHKEILDISIINDLVI